MEDRIRLARVIDVIADSAKRRIALPRNVDKGGWKDMTTQEVAERLQQENQEYLDALALPTWSASGLIDTPLEESGDVVAFLAMGLDNFADLEALNEPKPKGEE